MRNMAATAGRTYPQRIVRKPSTTPRNSIPRIESQTSRALSARPAITFFFISPHPFSAARRHTGIDPAQAYFLTRLSPILSWMSWEESLFPIRPTRTETVVTFLAL